MDAMNEDGLIDRWNALVDARESFLQEMDEFEPDQLATRPPEGGWCALQVMEHVLASETGTLGYMRKKTSSGWESLEPAGPEQIAAGEALVARLQSGERYSAPAILSEPLGLESYALMAERWESLRAEMELFVFALDEEYYNRLVFRQPAAGLLHLFHTLEFLCHHLNHHTPQLVRIRTALSK